MGPLCGILIWVVRILKLCLGLLRHMWYVLKIFLNLGKDNKKIFPTGKWVGVYFSEEFKYAVKLGYSVVPLSGYLFERKESPFKSYVSSLF